MSWYMRLGLSRPRTLSHTGHMVWLIRSLYMIGTRQTRTPSRETSTIPSDMVANSILLKSNARERLQIGNKASCSLRQMSQQECCPWSRKDPYAIIRIRNRSLRECPHSISRHEIQQSFMILRSFRITHDTVINKAEFVKQQLVGQLWWGLTSGQPFIAYNCGPFITNM